MTTRSGPFNHVVGGLYKGGGADISADIAAHHINVRGHTTYVSIAQGASGFPRTAWEDNFAKQGHLLNVVLELKVYGAPAPSSVPAPNGLMTFQGAIKYYSWTQVLAGDLDPLLLTVANAVKALPYNINLQICSERDTDHQSGGTIAGVAYSWAELDHLSVEGIEYIIDFFKAAGVRNATFTAGIGGFNHDAFVRCYVPGVDAIQFNAYNHGAWQEPLPVFARTYSWLANLPVESMDLPVYLAEYGSQPSTGGHSQAAWIASVPAAFTSLPRVAFASYFNSGWGTISDPASLDALATAYSTDPFLQ